jgi:uncharacterized protein (DUF1015 family)
MPPAEDAPPFEPIRALRYDATRVELGDVIAPPYDVITPAERAALTARSEWNVVRLILPERPNAAAQLLHDWRRDGVLVRDAEPAVWWHEQAFTGPDGRDRTRRGFVAAVRLSPYDDGRILPHEQTSAAIRAGQLELMRAVRANLSPILGLLDADGAGALDALAPANGAAPVMEATDDDATVHRFWPVRDTAAIAAAQRALADSTILIADGHHRYETALAYRDERRAQGGAGGGAQPHDLVLMYLADGDAAAAIYPTHRVVERAADLTTHTLHAFAMDERPPGTPPRALLAELEAVPDGKVAFAVWRGGDRPAHVAVLTDTLAARMAMPGVSRSLRTVDAAVLEAMVLAPLLGVATDEVAVAGGVRYVRDVDTAAGLVDGGEATMAFLLRAPSVEQVRAVAAEGQPMPQKSTYFFPKAYSGFLVQPLDDG